MIFFHGSYAGMIFSKILAPDTFRHLRGGLISVGLTLSWCLGLVILNVVVLSFCFIFPPPLSCSEASCRHENKCATAVLDFLGSDLGLFLGGVLLVFALVLNVRCISRQKIRLVLLTSLYALGGYLIVAHFLLFWLFPRSGIEKELSYTPKEHKQKKIVKKDSPLDFPGGYCWEPAKSRK